MLLCLPPSLGGAAFLPLLLWVALLSPTHPSSAVDFAPLPLLLGAAFVLPPLSGAAFSLPPCGWCCIASLCSFLFRVVLLSPLLLLGGAAFPVRSIRTKIAREQTCLILFFS